jgi:hypothetical protein
VRFTELEPRFVRIGPAGHEDTTFAEATGVWYWCPKCKGTETAHHILTWFENSPADVGPRWTKKGTSAEDITFDPCGDAPPAMFLRSVRMIGGCMAHFFVTAGEVTFAVEQ